MSYRVAGRAGLLPSAPLVVDMELYCGVPERGNEARPGP